MKTDNFNHAEKVLVLGAGQLAPPFSMRWCLR